MRAYPQDSGRYLNLHFSSKLLTQAGVEAVEVA